MIFLFTVYFQDCSIMSSLCKILLFSARSIFLGYNRIRWVNKTWHLQRPGLEWCYSGAMLVHSFPRARYSIFYLSVRTKHNSWYRYFFRGRKEWASQIAGAVPPGKSLALKFDSSSSLQVWFFYIIFYLSSILSENTWSLIIQQHCARRSCEDLPADLLSSWISCLR